MSLMTASPLNPVSAVAKNTNPANLLKASMLWKYASRRCGPLRRDCLWRAAAEERDRRAHGAGRGQRFGSGYGAARSLRAGGHRAGAGHSGSDRRRASDQQSAFRGKAVGSVDAVRSHAAAWAGRADSCSYSRAASDACGSHGRAAVRIILLRRRATLPRKNLAQISGDPCGNSYRITGNSDVTRLGKGCRPTSPVASRFWDGECNGDVAPTVTPTSGPIVAQIPFLYSMSVFKSSNPRSLPCLSLPANIPTHGR